MDMPRTTTELNQGSSIVVIVADDALAKALEQIRKGEKCRCGNDECLPDIFRFAIEFDSLVKTGGTPEVHPSLTNHMMEIAIDLADQYTDKFDIHALSQDRDVS